MVACLIPPPSSRKSPRWLSLRKAPAREQAITWYRSPLPPGEFKALHARSDWRGAQQTLGYLGVLACTAALALYACRHWPWWATLAAVFLHGTRRRVHDQCRA